MAARILDLNACGKSCYDCVLSYRKKHENDFKETGKSSFKLNCYGIPKEWPTTAAGIAALPDDSPIFVLDPVSWAAKYLDWHCFDEDGQIWARKNPEEYLDWVQSHPNENILGKSRYHRPYQSLMIRCLEEDTNVFMADGTVKAIKDVEPGEKVITYNEGRKSIQASYRVLNKWQSGVKDVYRIELDNGDTIKVTDNHPILSWFHEGKLNKLVNRKSFKRSYKSLRDGLSVGDKVYTLNKFGVFGEEDNSDLAKLLGYIVTDGYVLNRSSAGSQHIVSFSSIRKQYVEEFVALVVTVFGGDLPKVKYVPERVDKKGVVHKEYWHTYIKNGKHPLLVFLRSLGCCDKTNREMSLLRFAFRFSESALRHFLNRAYAGDGCVYNCPDLALNFLRTHIRLSSGNDEFLSLFRLLLKKIGIYASHIYEYVRDNGERTLSLDVSRIGDVETFLNFTGPIFGKEKQSLLAADQSGKRNHYRRHGGLKTLSRTFIRRIDYVGKVPVYDIEVEVRHNFIANGFVVHNCSSLRKISRIGRQAGKSVALGVLVLFYLFVKPGKQDTEPFKTVLLAPYQSQIDLIFKNLKDLIMGSPYLANSIHRHIKSPQYVIELNNGSYVIGFTAGTKSGSGAASARGQTADFLVLDEADYLSKEDFNAAMSIITNCPRAVVWMSSTPTGRREKFYDLCHSLLWREYFFPAYVNPMWTEELAETVRETLTTAGWEHEVEARFGELEQGVYQHKYIELASDSYEYGDLKYNPDWVYVMGVDWNDVAIGTNIYVVGYNPFNRRYYGVDKDIVKKDEWTQLAACQKIAEMNRQWKCKAIYIDKGFGNVQGILLQKWGHDALRDLERGKNHPDAKLRSVKFFDFGSAVEITNPWTKQKEKKFAKAFLVDNAVRFFESGIFLFPVSDKELKDQLGGYYIDHVSEGGKPKYVAGAAGDHLLDAMMLALVAYALEFHSIGKPTFSSNIAFAPPILSPSAEEAGGETVTQISSTEVFVGTPAGKPRKVKMGGSGSGRSEILSKRPFSRNAGVPAEHMRFGSQRTGYDPDELIERTRKVLPRTRNSVILRQGNRFSGRNSHGS